MFAKHLIARTGPAGAVALAALVAMGSTASAAAKDSKHACMPAYASYKEALANLKAGRLHDGRERLKECMQSGCARLQPKCAAVSEKVLSAMPTVVFSVTDESGAPHADVEVSVDGDVIVTKLDGMGVPVEPGIRDFAFAIHGEVFSTQRVMILEGQRNRPVGATISGPGAPSPKALTVAASASDPKPAPEPTAISPVAADEGRSEPAPSGEPPPHEQASSGGWAPPRSAFPYAMGGIGLAGVGAGVLLTVWGNKDNSNLQNECSPNCHPASIDRVRAMYIAADVSFGVGIAGLGVATWLVARSRSEELPQPKSAVIDIHPTPSGAFASVSGAF